MLMEGRNQKNIRLENLMKVLRILAFHGPFSRKQLTQQMGLSKMSISNLVNTFLERGLIEETKVQEDLPVTAGPKPVLLQIVPGQIVAIGIHISEDYMVGQLVDVTDGLLYEKKILISEIKTKSQFTHSLKSIVQQMMDYDKEQALHITSIGITDHSYINRKEGSVAFKGNTLGIDQSFIKDCLQQQYDIPVYIENDGMGILLTEMAYGYYDYHKKYYFLDISDEIRGAFASGYYIQKGCFGLSGQVGHMSIKCDGPRCRCGNRGCYEAYGSIHALLKESNCSTIKELNANLDSREPVALRALETFIQATTVALTNIVNLYDPEAIVVVGQILELDQSILKKIEYLVNDSFMFRKERNIHIVPSKLKKEMYRKGSAILAFYQLLRDNDIISKYGYSKGKE